MSENNLHTYQAMFLLDNQEVRKGFAAEEAEPEEESATAVAEPEAQTETEPASGAEEAESPESKD